MGSPEPSCVTVVANPPEVGKPVQEGVGRRGWVGRGEMKQGGKELGQGNCRQIWWQWVLFALTVGSSVFFLRLVRSKSLVLV